MERPATGLGDYLSYGLVLRDLDRLLMQTFDAESSSPLDTVSSTVSSAEDGWIDGWCPCGGPNTRILSGYFTARNGGGGEKSETETCIHERSAWIADT